MQARPELAQIVDLYLPGASANQGWSEEIQTLLLPGTHRVDDVNGAVRSGLERVLAIASNPDFAEEEAITIPDLSNLVYAVGALSHIPEIDPGDQLYEKVLSLALPQGIVEERISVANAFLTQKLIPELWGWEAWPQFIKTAAEENWVMDLVAKVPQCRTAVVTINGYESVVIDADLESDTVSFNRLINVVDPRNWPKSYPSFFCRMEDAALRGDKWYNIKETAGFSRRHRWLQARHQAAVHQEQPEAQPRRPPRLRPR